MEHKEAEHIGEFFFSEMAGKGIDPQKQWDEIFSGWIAKIEQEKQSLNLFELKLWLEALEEFCSSTYLEKLVFRHQSDPECNYDFHVLTFHLVSGRITALLKELDFKKDKYFINFEEFIVDKVLEESMNQPFAYLRELYAPESWFNSFRIFLHNFKNITAEILRNDAVSQRAFTAIKKLYHKELIGNPILLTLLKKQFIPQMDKIFQPDISRIFSAIKDKNLKKVLGIFFVLAFRVLKINSFIEANISRSKNLEMAVPLVLALRKNVGHIMAYCEGTVAKSLTDSGKEEKALKEVLAVFKNLELESKKIFEGEFALYFSPLTNKNRKRKLLKNVVVISEMAVQELIEKVARLFAPEISGAAIFENYISRKQKSIEVKKKLIKLHTKIGDYFAHKGSLAASEISSDINQFMETDLNYLLYKDWNEFLSHAAGLNRASAPAEFDPALRAFYTFLTKTLKEIVSEKK